MRPGLDGVSEHAAIEFGNPQARLLDNARSQWSAGDKVNLKHLFSRHHEPQTIPSQAIYWLGRSGNAYQYECYPIHTVFRPVPGNYIYAKRAEDGIWVPIY